MYAATDGHDLVGVVAVHAANFLSRKHEYGPYFRDFLEVGAAVKDADQAKAVQYRKDFSTKYRAVLSTVDAFAYPADSTAARDQFRNSYNPSLGAFLYTYPADLSGTPTITLPLGLSSEGLPLSMQFVGQALSEATLCRIGQAYEEATGWYKKHPNV